MRIFKKKPTRLKNLIPKFFLHTLTRRPDTLKLQLQGDISKLKTQFERKDILEAFINTVYSKASMKIQDEILREKVLKFVLQDYLEEFKEEWQILEAEANLIKRIN